MSNLPKDLLEYAGEVTAKYPEVSKKIILEILENAPQKIDKKEYELAFVVQQKLGLSSGYFSKACTRKIDIKADIVKEGTFLFVKLDYEIKRLLDDGFICCKITQDEADSFLHTIWLTKNTLLGFYK